MSGASGVREGSGSVASTVFRWCCLSWPSAATMRHWWRTPQRYEKRPSDCVMPCLFLLVSGRSRIWDIISSFFFFFLPLKNRLHESLQLFTSICTNSVFYSTSLVSLSALILADGLKVKHEFEWMKAWVSSWRLAWEAFWYWFMSGGEHNQAMITSDMHNYNTLSNWDWACCLFKYVGCQHCQTLWLAWFNFFHPENLWHYWWARLTHSFNIHIISALY